MRHSSTSQLVTRSVGESASGVACSVSRWCSASIASHGLLKRGCIEFKNYVDAIHFGLTPPG